MEDKKKDRELESVRTYIRRILKSKGMYSEEMSYQVELLASDLLVFRKIRKLVLSEEEKPVITEESREGKDRKRENPLYGLMAKFADRVRRDLRSLKMNKELSAGEQNQEIPEDDALSRLMDEVNKE